MTSPTATLNSAPQVAAGPRPALTVPRFLVLGLAHAVLGALLINSSLATPVAALVLGIALAIAIRSPENGPYVAAYVAGSELLWRMSQAGIPWESAKYISILALFASLRRHFRWTPISTLAVSHFLMLLPSILLTLQLTSLHDARTRIAFNLSGPATVMAAILAFECLPLEQFRPSRLLGFLLIPVFGVCSKILLGIARAEEIVFEAEASFVTSGGYGPNQVSTLLGGATLGFVLLGLQTPHRNHRILFLALGGGVLLQGILTFSRGGVFAAVLAIVVLLAHILLKPRQAGRLLPVIIVLSLAFWFVVLPRANAWTGGLLSERFQSFDPAQRQQLAQSDLDLFLENPVLGVGPGMAGYKRKDEALLRYAAHTEVTRAISEHGLLGVVSLLCLVGASTLAYLRAPTPGARAWLACLVVWGLANSMTAAMRLAIVPFGLGLAFIDFSRLRSGRS